MIVLREKCVCGATLELEDNRGTFAVSGGGIDGKGRRFQIEVIRDKWHEEHALCLEIHQGKVAPKDNPPRAEKE